MGPLGSKPPRAAGYYHGPMDGFFEAGLEEAMKRYQRDHRLKVTAQIRLVEYLQLGFSEVDQLVSWPPRIYFKDCSLI
ncbi:peptidoglycan-binding domain-containing protein [Polycladomyces abyssicola]|uniref:peptidoglycan-binding domain-containing protein n=1 Tax=Polycladomyces abyssicola TaxID=1125966 RepID=UPI003B832A10